MMAAAAKNTEATAASASGTVELALAHVSIARDRQTRGDGKGARKALD